MADILGVLLLADKAHTGSLAALDLILQTGPQAIAEVAVFALTDLEGLLQQSETFPYRTGTRIGAEIASLGLFRTAVQPQPGIGILTGEVDIGIGLVVPKQDVVRRSGYLDQALFEQQGLGFVGRDRGIDMPDARNQCRRLRAQPSLAKVAGQALLQVVGLAYIEQLPFGIEHPVDTRLCCNRLEEGRSVEGGTGHA